MAIPLQEALVRDLMTADLISCRRDASIATVASTLAHRRVHAVFVLHNDGTPAGVVSDFDLLTAEWLADDADGLRTMQNVTAAELMTTPVEQIYANAPARDAAARMRELHLSRLLVTNDSGSAVGVSSVSDLIAPLGRHSGARAVVEDVMSRAIVSCSPETTLTAAARAMTQRHSRWIVAIDQRGCVVGVITGNDLLSLYELGAPAASVADLMSPPITCAPDLPLSKAADLMIRHEIHRLVVTSSSERDAPALGILSTSDIVAEMALDTSVWQGTRKR
jgi:CBS domain-containing protein